MQRGVALSTKNTAGGLVGRVPCLLPPPPPPPSGLEMLGLRQGLYFQGERAKRQRPQRTDSWGRVPQRDQTPRRQPRREGVPNWEPGVRRGSVGAQAHLRLWPDVSPDPTAPPSAGHRKHHRSLGWSFPEPTPGKGE